VQAVTNPSVQTAYAEAIVRGVANFHGIAYVPPATAQPAPAAPEQPAPAAAPAEAAPAPSREATAATGSERKPLENTWIDGLLKFIVG
jgi:hypothetical protein